MKYNNNTQNISLWAKTISLLMVFVFSVANVLALPGITSTNLQTTAGVTVTSAGNTLDITAPNKSVLTWQNFGSGGDNIAAGHVLNYTLPTKNSSVLNIVAGAASTSIDGTISSNGNVYILNPNGIVVGNNARIDVNRLNLSTSDNPSFASFYFQQNGALPSQDGLIGVSGNVSINAGATIATAENTTIISKNVTVGGVLSQGNLVVNADGNVTVGSTGMTYVSGDLIINNVSGLTTLGSNGNNLIVTNNITSTGTVNSSFNTVGNAIQAKNLSIVGGNIVSDRVVTNNVTANGTNVTLNVGSGIGASNVNVTGNGAVSVNAPASLTLNLTNIGSGATTVTAGGNLTLNRVQVEGTAGASFTGTNVSDTSSRIFVYGATTFNATGGNVSINKGAHSFGPVSVSATGEAVVYEDAAVNLNVVNTPKFTLHSSDYVFQTPTTGVINSALVTVLGGNITLNAANNSAGNYTVAGKDVTFSNNGALTISALSNGNATITSTGAVTLAETNAVGTLSVTSGGAISQTTDAKVSSFGATNFVGTGLNLSNSGNKFGGVTIDVTAGGTATIAEETTLNLLSLRAANATVRSTNNVITTGLLPVAADTFNIVAGVDFVPAANFRATNAITVLAGGNVDLSSLSLLTNLNNKNPSVIAKGYKAPQP